ncbi:hypothetical protein CPB86DRAFT_790154 [Serendipita vermifera]|nr:hypothetical protein CPB86DRAFT_790154 [Serendipita vermifera]
MSSTQAASSQHPPTSFNNRTPPVIETDKGPVTLVRFNGLQELPAHSQAATRAHPHLSNTSVGTHPGGVYGSGSSQPNQNGHYGYGQPPLEPVKTIKGYKAPMTIAAMFSVQQNIPESISKFTLVQIDCEVPLRPVRPHEKYARLYTPHGIADETNVPGFRQSPSSAANRAGSSAMQPSAGMAPRDPSTSTSSVEPTQGAAAKVEVKEEERVIDEDAQIPNLKPLPPDLYEERNSWYPRSRYCYHPAEYDPGQVLPGPGVIDLAYDEAMAARQVYTATEA